MRPGHEPEQARGCGAENVRRPAPGSSLLLTNEQTEAQTD